jgi:carbonic anhydrase
MPRNFPHTAKVLVFTCIDERLEPTVTALIESFKGGSFHVAMAGGGATFTTEPDCTVALKQIRAAYGINHVTDIYLQSHMDCGAYGLAGITFASPADEAARLYADLDQAAATVKKALVEAGATSAETNIHIEVIDLDGTPVPRPELARVA